MRPFPRRTSLIFVAILAFAPAAGAVADQARGILEPLYSTCEQETHHIVDACTGSTVMVRSTLIDLDQVACQEVVADGSPTGTTCPGLEIGSLSPTTPECPLEVRGIGFVLLSDDPTLKVTHLACSDSYDIVYGLIGAPAVGACDAAHPCATDEYCDTLPGECGGVGVCKPKPPACLGVWLPVCGCNGVTYSNDCSAYVSDAPIACDGVCPCPEACTSLDGCLDVGSVVCRYNDIGAQYFTTYMPFDYMPPLGQAAFVFVRAKGPGAIGVTTYGFTSDGVEREFARDCSR